MSVVPDDFEELKRYNIAEIFNPTPKEEQTKQPSKEDNPSKEDEKAATDNVVDAPEEPTQQPIVEAKESVAEEAPSSTIEAAETAKVDVAAEQ